MVAGAVARSCATPEPRVRAFPSRGSSEYGPLSLAPWAVNDVVTVSVHQAQVVEGVDRPNAKRLAYRRGGLAFQKHHLGGICHDLIVGV